MIDLGQPMRTVAGLTLAADHRRARHFHVLPGAPRVARDGAGRPLLSLLRLVRDGELARGLLDVTVEVPWPAEAAEEARAALADELGSDEVTVGPLEVTAAEAELFVAAAVEGAAEGAPPPHAPVATVTAAFASPWQARFAMELAPEAVGLLEAALRTASAPVGVTWRLAVDALRPARRVVARVDWGRVYDHFSEHVRTGAVLVVGEVRRLVERLVEDRVVEIDAVEGLSDADEAAATDGGGEGEGGEGEGEARAPGSVAQVLEWLQRELIERFMVPALPLSREPATASLGTVGEILGLGHAYAVKSLTQVERSRAVVDFQRPDAVSRTVTVQAHLADLLGGADPDEHVASVTADHPFFRRMTFTLEAARPLSEAGVAEVAGSWRWGPEGRALRLTPAAPSAVAEDWHDASPEGRWELDLVVTMAEDAPVAAGEALRPAPLSGSARRLTLDVAGLVGLARLEILPAPAGEEPLLGTRLTLVHARGEEELDRREIVSREALGPTGLWLRDVREGDRVSLTPMWLLASGRVVTGEPIPVRTRVVPVPPPVTWRTVRIVADERWEGVDHLVVSVAAREGGPVRSVVLEEPGQRAALRLEAPEGADGRWRFAVRRVMTDGEVVEEPWAETDVTTLLLGRSSPFVLDVEVRPVGPELPQAGLRLIEVRLLYVDPEHQVRHSELLTFSSVSEEARWTVPIVDPARRTYEVTLVLHRMDGTSTTLPRRTTDERLLLIPVAAG